MLWMIFNVGFSMYYKISQSWFLCFGLFISAVAWKEKQSFWTNLFIHYGEGQVPLFVHFLLRLMISVMLGGSLYIFCVCVGFSCRGTSYCPKEPGLGTTYVQLTLAYQLGIPALGTGYVFMSAENSIISWFTLLTSLASSKLFFSSLTQTLLKTSELSRCHFISFSKLCINGNLVH